MIATGLAITMASCSLRERVQLNANNSVSRNMEFKLDSGAASKLVAIAKTQGQNTNVMDSVSLAWDSLSSYVKKNALQYPNATAESSPWNNNTHTGTMQFKLPNLDTYNQFASNTIPMPNVPGNKLPIGGLKRENIAWKGKDTLVIQLDNSQHGTTEGIRETQETVGLIKIMIGLEALVQYKADFVLPRPAKAVIGEGAALSADKRTVTYSKPLDEPNAVDEPTEIKVVF